VAQLGIAKLRSTQRTETSQNWLIYSNIFHNYYAPIFVTFHKIYLVTFVKLAGSTEHIIDHIETGFYESNDPTNSVKALKEERVLSIRLQSHQVHSNVLTMI